MHTDHRALILLFSLVIMATGCRPTDTPVPSVHGIPVKDVVILSSREFSEAGISTGAITQQLISRYIECDGSITLPYSSVIQVTSHASGILQAVNCLPGNYAEKGSVLAVIESMDLLRLQQAFLEAKNQLEFEGATLKRQGELTMENASSIKKLEQASRDYQESEIKARSLKAQLALMGIDADSVDIDHLTSSIEIKAPVSAYVSEIYGIPGEFLPSGKPLFEMTRHETPVLMLEVPEKFIREVRVRQMVNFSIAPGHPMMYQGRLVSIGRKIDPATQTFTVRAALLQAPELLPGTSVKARILTATERAASIPTAAIVNDTTGQVIFVKKGLVFERVLVHAVEYDTLCSELRNFPPAMIHDSIVTGGVEYLVNRFRIIAEK
jgi:cobalt-zinc-cadmium efflux system membrane fusion protein